MPQEINSLFAVATVLVLLVIWRGLFAWAMQRERDAVMHLAMGVSAIIWAVVFRALYWDILPGWVDWVSPGLWETWGNASGWTRVNIVWDLLLIYGGYHLLRALQMTIPEHERNDWPLWRTPFYPRGHIFERVYRWVLGRAKGLLAWWRAPR